MLDVMGSCADSTLPCVFHNLIKIFCSWFCFWCRAPNPDTVLIIQTPLGVFSTKSLIQNKKKSGSRLISSNRIELQQIPTVETDEFEPFSAARCRIFRRSKSNTKVPQMKVIYFLVSCSLLGSFIVSPLLHLKSYICWPCTNSSIESILFCCPFLIFLQFYITCSF